MNAWLKGFVLFSSLCSVYSYGAQSGGVTVGGTRVIFDGNKKEASLSVTNSDASPYLIQSWVEIDGNANNVPFFVTPPLFKLEPNQKNVLRIVKTGTPLENKETMYWLSIKSIPSTAKNANVNTLQVAVRTRIKLIYRPASLKGVPEQVAQQLTWRQSGKNLTVTNPTPYIMNFYKVTVGGREVKDATYVLPESQATFTSQASGPVTWKIISDYGGVGNEHSNNK